VVSTLAQNATVVTLRVLLLAVHLTLIFSPSQSLSSVVLYRYTMFFTSKVNRPKCEANQFASSGTGIQFCLEFPVTACENRLSLSAILSIVTAARFTYAQVTGR